MKEYTFAYGNGSVTIPLDESQVQAELYGNNIPGIPDMSVPFSRFSGL